MSSTTGELLNKYNKALNIFGSFEDHNASPHTITIENIINNINIYIKTKIITNGRIITHRNSKMFIIISHKSHTIQCYIPPKTLQDIKTILVIGDIIEVHGTCNYSSTNTLTIFIEHIKILNKCLINIPDQYFIEHKKEKYRIENRTLYLTFNLIANQLIQIRFEIIKQIRQHLYKNNFLEADTPTLCKIAGGATATPFTTKYLLYNSEFQLRIAPELYLKRLVIAGFNKIFEICHNFRNEGASILHNPEFTMLEVYETNIEITQGINNIINLIQLIVDVLNTRFKQKITLNLANITKIDFYDVITKLIPDANKKSIQDIIKVAKQYNIQLDDKIEENPHNIYHIYDDIISKYYIPKFYSQQIVILQNHPVEISPLAKIHKNNDRIAQRFEIYLYGIEIVDGFQENNNYSQQYKVFQQQEKQYNRKVDYHFCDDIKIGLPNTIGYGFGIDRVIKLLMKMHNIREVIPFIE